jgi:protein SCO1/2
MNPAYTSRRVAFALVASIVVSGACQPRTRQESDASDEGAAAYGLRGSLYPAALAKPEFVLTDTQSQPFDFRRETDGYVTLLYFGYTHCPDVCPIQMATLGAVMRELPPAVRERIKVVFVTTDPARDTPERLKEWLHNFDDSFIGLTGDTAVSNAAQRALLLPLPQAGPTDSTGGYEVGHAAAVVAFTPDDSAHVRYPFGIRQADWAHDLPRLVGIQWSDH